MKLDRGFTVEGLTVTYMPRPISENADVLQQRARFFGYRGEHIDYCRVYVLKSAKEAFVDYVDDEEFLRSSLKRHEGEPLSRWKRDFTLHDQFARPTRANAIGRRVSRASAGREWSWPKSMHLGADVRRDNDALFTDALRRSQDFLFDAAELPGAVDRRATERNLAREGVNLEDALEFLLQVRAGSVADSLLLNTITMQIARTIREPRDSDPKSATFVFMSELKVPNGPGRQLRVLRETLHVGKSPKGAVGDALNYSGDDSFRSKTDITIQLRAVHLTDAPPDGESYSRVPWLAISLPTSVSHDYFLEQ